MFDVVLSYRRKSTTEFCSFLYEILSREGYEVFFDCKSLQQGDYNSQIDKAISECSLLLVVLAPDDLVGCLTNPRDHILHEVRMAMAGGKDVIPIKAKDGFHFLKDTGLQELDYLARQQLCDLSGPGAATRARTILIEKYIKESPHMTLGEEFHSGLLTEEYQKWEMETLSSIYSGFPFVNEFSRQYPVVVLEGADDIAYPFDQLNEEEHLDLEDVGKPLDYEGYPLVDDFKRIEDPNIHYPDLYGFTNVGILFDEEGKVTGFKAKPRTYKETVFTSHILQYELWQAYCKIGSQRAGSLNDLPMRKAIHDERGNWDVLLSGCNRSSLSDICIAILAYDEMEDDYDVAIATRSDKVACYPGYLSIIPSGGFELYELENMQTPAIIKKNFSVRAALFREYIEEIFGEGDFDSPTGDDDLRRLFRNPHVRKLVNGIHEGNVSFEFSGVTFDVISLRPTFSFVLKIDDPGFLYESDIHKNQENKDIRFVSLGDFEQMVLDSQNSSPLIPESAGVYSLLKKSHLFKEACEQSSHPSAY